MIGRRNQRRVVSNDNGTAEQSPTLAQLRWRLAAYRSCALRRVELCIAGVAALRQFMDEPALDVVLSGFRAVRDELGIMDPEAPVEIDEIQSLADRLVALQMELARIASIRVGPDAAEDWPPGLPA
jgi:hypothetical protein